MLEAWRNITATGAQPLAVTDNLNFGNPEVPEIMGHFADAVAGIKEACTALDFPVVSGNVSLYNQTTHPSGLRVPILPTTPAIGAIGVIADIDLSVGYAMPDEAELVLVGEAGVISVSHSGCERYVEERTARRRFLDLVAERRNGDFVREGFYPRKFLLATMSRMVAF